MALIISINNKNYYYYKIRTRINKIKQKLQQKKLNNLIKRKIIMRKLVSQMQSKMTQIQRNRKDRVGGVIEVRCF